MMHNKPTIKGKCFYDKDGRKWNAELLQHLVEVYAAALKVKKFFKKREQELKEKADTEKTC